MKDGKIMLFSIIVPVYNVEKYLDECIQSIISQNEFINGNCELVLVDDGSTDNSGVICDKYQEKYPNTITVYHNENQGLLLTRRFGFNKAKGKYIINCDSDDKLEENSLEILHEIIDRYQAPDVILYNYNTYDGVNKIARSLNLFSEKESSLVPKEEVLRKFFYIPSVMSMWGKCCKRICIDLNKDYRQYKQIGNGEDSLQTVEIFDNANSFVYLNQVLYDYRKGSGMTGKFDSNFYANHRVIINQMEKRKNQWALKDFDKLMTIKVLTTIGRSITQSRYCKNMSLKEHVNYLKILAEDDFFRKYVKLFPAVKKRLQNDYVILVKLLSAKKYLLIVVLLRIKNLTD